MSNVYDKKEKNATIKCRYWNIAFWEEVMMMRN